MFFDICIIKLIYNIFKAGQVVEIPFEGAFFSKEIAQIDILDRIDVGKGPLFAGDITGTIK